MSCGLKRQVAPVSHGHGVFLAIQRHLRDLLRARQLRGHELIDLRYGEPFFVGGVLVDGDGQFRTLSSRPSETSPAPSTPRAISATSAAACLSVGRSSPSMLMEMPLAAEHGDVHGTGLHAHVQALLRAKGGDVRADLLIGTLHGLVDDDVVGQAFAQSLLAAANAHH